MAEKIEYKFACSSAIFDYLKSGDDERLLKKLHEINNHAKDKHGGRHEDIWFRFGKSSIATTIPNIEKDIKLPKSHSNKAYLLECFEDVVNKNDLTVYYS